MSVVETMSDLSRSSGNRPRRWLTSGMMFLGPITYAALFNLSFRVDENPFDGPDGIVILILFVLKLVTVVALVVGVHRIGTRIAASPALAWSAAAIWVSVGVALATGVAWAKSRGVSLGVDHLWPGRSDNELVNHLDPGPGSGWETTSIVMAELLTVVLLAVGAAMLLRFAGRRLAQAIVTFLTVVGFLTGLVMYDLIFGWPVMFDFDPFVGDAVLGVLTYELLFFFGPIDPLGSLALAGIAAANGLILLVARVVPHH